MGTLSRWKRVPSPGPAAAPIAHESTVDAKDPPVLPLCKFCRQPIIVNGNTSSSAILVHLATLSPYCQLGETRAKLEG